MLEKENKTDLGMVKLHNEVIASIAALAAKEVKGVARLTDTFLARIIRFLGQKNFSAGVKVVPDLNETKVYLYIVVDYGANIPALAKEVQENVSRKIEEMTGLYNIEVLVSVQGVTLAEKAKHE